MRCGHEHDDGAYVLGALSPSERASYERHLATCSFCREAVADIAVLPGLLGRLDPDDFAKLLDPTLTAPPTQRNRVPALMTAAQTTRRRERERERRQLVGAALAAACLALVAGIGAVFFFDPDPAPTAPTTLAVSAPTTVAMRPVAEEVALKAGVNLTETEWGTKVYMECDYAKDAPSPKSYTFRLMAYGPDDEVEQVGSWVAAPGAEVKMTGMTRFSGGSLNRLELIRFDGKALLSYDVP